MYASHDFTPDQHVAVIDRRGYIRIKKVAEVRTYKKMRTKVILNDGSMWDTNGHPYRTASTWDTGSTMRPMTDELQVRWLDQRRKKAVEWVLSSWDTLPEDVRKQLGDAAGSARKAAE